MKIQCAWCGKDMGEKPPYEDKSITHSICEECQKKYFPEAEKEEGTMDKHGVTVSGLARDLANSECFHDYEKAVKFSEKFDEKLKDADWLELYDGTTFQRSFTPSPSYLKEVDSAAKDALEHNPLSAHCEAVLATPPKCYDFRGIRSYVMCKAWDILEKEKRAKLPVSEAWAEARKVCVRD